ncbi:hypothetical protein VTK26DRAFT_3968 [Humicola hyalothermophila]
MLFKQYLITALMAAAASVALALPRPDVIDLAVRESYEDYDTLYKRGVTETFVCKRGENQSLSCLRKKDGFDLEAVDQSETANI